MKATSTTSGPKKEHSNGQDYAQDMRGRRGRRGRQGVVVKMETDNAAGSLNLVSATALTLTFALRIVAFKWRECECEREREKERNRITMCVFLCVRVPLWDVRWLACRATQKMDEPVCTVRKRNLTYVAVHCWPSAESWWCFAWTYATETILNGKKNALD